MSKKAIIAMSGGVDSSVAAFLLKEAGYVCRGMTLKLYENEDVGESCLKSCCSLRDAGFARSVAEQLGLPFEVRNLGADFRAEVMDRFVAAYWRGETPNPCIDCNRYIKFSKLIDLAVAEGEDYVATGHYARVRYDAPSGRYRLLKGLDAGKDQSYALYTLNQEQLSRLLLPLGELSKAEVRAIAERERFANADKQDSQDICFVRDGDYAAFIEAYSGRSAEPGDFVDAAGRVLGRHKGIIRYTIGQRKGLGVAAAQPLFVTEIRPESREVVLGPSEALLSRELIADEVNWVSLPGLDAPRRLKAKIRYRQRESDCLAEVLEDGRLRLRFDEAQRAVTKGQAVVLYEGDAVVGGGRICATAAQG